MSQKWSAAIHRSASAGLPLVTVPLLRDAGLPAHVFYELLGFNTPDPQKRVDEARAQARQTNRRSG